MKKKQRIVALGMIVSMGISGLTACQKSPGSSLVNNKDFDNMIEAAQNTGDGVQVGDLVQEYETYQTTIQSDSLGVTVQVDAKVDIPQTEQLSIFRVAQTTFTQEQLDRIKEELTGGTQLYEGRILEVQTKKDILSEIQILKDEMKQLDGSGEDEESIQIYKDEYQAQIDELQAVYETAPDQYNWSDYLSDGTIHGVEELYNNNKSDSFYSWQYSLNPNGEVYYGISDGNDLTYQSLFLQNNPDYGNCIRYRKNTHGYDFVATTYLENTNLEKADALASEEAFMTERSGNIWSANTEMPETLANSFDGTTFVEITDEPVTMTQEEAISIADSFLEQVGIEGFEYYQGGLFYELLDIREASDLEGTGYRKEYILNYMRNIDGAFVTYDSVGKHDEGWRGDDYVKKAWPIEVIEFRINDSGIVGFDYNAPLTMVETVVEQSNLKSFDVIRDTFEQMVVVINAEETEEDKCMIQIDRVVLGYARISEQDNYDTGLLVPVWDFKGTVTEQSGEETIVTYRNVMTINAIDGTIVDRELGY
ncbi:MAG: hypothetical protein J6B50_04825 [Lachnospiraceae bacterium]|nr:hypothetical protein [Lachnospiraceae bacterium]